MSDHFIKNIEIKNFKCFEDFKAEGFGRVNLIGGKNNVGKTAFMEAIYISSDSIQLEGVLDDVIPFLQIESLRGIINIKNILVSDIIDLFDKYEKLDIKTNNALINLKIKKNGIEEKFLINDNDYGLSRRLNKEPVGVKKKLYNFIPSYMVGDDLIVSIFDKIKEQRKRDKLNQFLNEFDKNILEFDIINDKPQVFLESSQKFQDVVELGHGLKRYIAIISSILINKKGFLFLDELENGVHYTHIDKLWEIILTISKQQNVQVFATTHSKECIESYARVAKKLEDKEITFFKLGKNEEGELKGMVYPYDWFVDSIDQEQEMRGW